MAEWIPHERETWPSRYGTLKSDVTMSFYRGYWEDGDPVMREVKCPKGTRVKIVMVSRFGDVGITNDLDSERNYGKRVFLQELDDLSAER